VELLMIVLVLCCVSWRRGGGEGFESSTFEIGHEVCFIISRAFPTIEYALQMLLLKHPYNNKKVKEDHERVFALIICTPRHAKKGSEHASFIG
jgi:hypothetical protein